MYTNTMTAASALLTMIKTIEHSDGSDTHEERISATSHSMDMLFKGLRRAVVADGIPEDELTFLCDLRKTNLRDYVRGLTDEIEVETHTVALSAIIDCLLDLIEFTITEGE